MHRPTNFKYRATNHDVEVFLIPPTMCEPNTRIAVFVKGIDESLRVDDVPSLNPDVADERFIETLREFKADKVTISTSKDSVSTC